MKPVLFIDFDGTLCQDKFWRSLPPGVLAQIKIFEFDEERIAERWMHGEFTSEEVNQRIAETIGMNYEDLWRVFVENCSTMTVSPKTLGTISALRTTFYTVLITDNMDCFDRFTLPSLQLEKYFDLIVNSYNEKRGKDDDGGKSLIAVAKRFHSDIRRCVLIDNSEKTCALFTKLGGTSYLIDHTNTIDTVLSAIKETRAT